jgi:hypothetical protein
VDQPSLRQKRTKRERPCIPLRSDRKNLGTHVALSATGVRGDGDLEFALSGLATPVSDSERNTSEWNPTLAKNAQGWGTLQILKLKALNTVKDKK